MHMYFWWDYVVKNFHFYSFNLTSIIALVVTCIVLLGLSFLFEYVKTIQAKIKQKSLMLTQRQLRSICPSESDTLLTNNAGPSTSTNSQRPSQSIIITKKDRTLQFVYDISVWLFHNVLGYFLMLTIMLYNGYMFIAIVMGSAVGYFVCGRTLIRINIENCRALRSTFCMSDCGDPDKTALLAPGNVTENQSGGTSPPICHTLSTTVSETVNEIVQS